MGNAQRGLAIVIGSGYQPPAAMIQQLQADGQFAGCTEVTAIADPYGWLDEASYEGKARAAAVMHAQSKGYNVSSCQILTQYGDYPRYGGRFYLVRVIDQNASTVNAVEGLEGEAAGVLGCLFLLVIAGLAWYGIASIGDEEDSGQPGGVPPANQQLMVRDAAEAPDGPVDVEPQGDANGDAIALDSDVGPAPMADPENGVDVDQAESPDGRQANLPADQSEVARANQDDPNADSPGQGVEPAKEAGAPISDAAPEPKQPSSVNDGSVLLSVGTTVWKGLIHDTEDKEQLEVEVELTRTGDELNGRVKVPSERMFFRIRGELVGGTVSFRAFEKSGESRKLLFPFTVSGELTNEGLDGKWSARKRNEDVSGRFELQPDSTEP